MEVTATPMIEDKNVTTDYTNYYTTIGGFGITIDVVVSILIIFMTTACIIYIYCRRQVRLRDPNELGQRLVTKEEGPISVPCEKRRISVSIGKTINLISVNSKVPSEEKINVPDYVKHVIGYFRRKVTPEDETISGSNIDEIGPIPVTPEDETISGSNIDEIGPIPVTPEDETISDTTEKTTSSRRVDPPCLAKNKRFLKEMGYDHLIPLTAKTYGFMIQEIRSAERTEKEHSDVLKMIHESTLSLLTEKPWETSIAQKLFTCVFLKQRDVVPIICTEPDEIVSFLPEIDMCVIALNLLDFITFDKNFQHIIQKIGKMISTVNFSKRNKLILIMQQETYQFLDCVSAENKWLEKFNKYTFEKCDKIEAKESYRNLVHHVIHMPGECLAVLEDMITLGEKFWGKINEKKSSKYFRIVTSFKKIYFFCDDKRKRVKFVHKNVEKAVFRALFYRMGSSILKRCAFKYLRNFVVKEAEPQATQDIEIVVKRIENEIRKRPSKKLYDTVWSMDFWKSGTKQSFYQDRVSKEIENQENRTAHLRAGENKAENKYVPNWDNHLKFLNAWEKYENYQRSEKTLKHLDLAFKLKTPYVIAEEEHLLFSLDLFMTPDLPGSHHKMCLERMIRIMTQKLENSKLKNRFHQMAHYLQKEITSFLKYEFDRFSSIKKVWCGTKAENMKKSIPLDTAVVLLGKDVNIELKSILGIDVIFRGENQFSDEDNSLWEEGNVKYKGKTIELKSKTVRDLLNSHSNISLISLSSVRSKGYSKGNHTTDAVPCITIYCHVKGIVPVGENLFPSIKDGLDVDVRELVITIASERKLCLGEGINAHKNQSLNGTVGGFVEFGNQHVFLTCAHSVFVDHNLRKEEINLEQGIDIICNSDSKLQMIGKAHKGFFQCNKNEKGDDVFIDAAMVNIDEKNIQESGYFKTTKEDILNAGFLSGRKLWPHYFSGKTRVITKHDRGLHVVKIGTKTGLTAGKIRNPNASPNIEVNENITTRYWGQIEIGPYDRDKTFAVRGDSGSFVFAVEELDPPYLTCIGMLNSVSRGKNQHAFITPIHDILKSFKLSEQNLKKFANPYRVHFDHTSILQKQILKEIEHLTEEIDEQSSILEEIKSKVNSESQS